MIVEKQETSRDKRPVMAPRSHWGPSTSSGVLVVALVVSGCAAVVSSNEFGVKDSASAILIDRANELSALRARGSYQQLAERLEAERATTPAGGYAWSRIGNELADLYSYQLLDLERAREIDNALLKAPLLDTGREALVPSATVASQRILADPAYVKDYLSVGAQQITQFAQLRTAQNTALLEGAAELARSKYDLDYLKRHYETVQRDVASTPPNSAARRTILSRLIRADAELCLKDERRRPSHADLLLSSLPLAQVDLAEISFLQLSDYLMRAFRAGTNRQYGELALQSVYLPYSNIRDPAFRWKYNKLINQYIGELIDASYKGSAFDDLLYYVSLNKSRMLLEERLALSRRTSGSRLTDVAKGDEIPRTAFGLPDRAWFDRKLLATNRYLDFYVSGRYERVSGAATARPEPTTAPVSTRDFGIESANQPEESFVDDSLYTLRVEQGRVVDARRLVGAELRRIQQGLSDSYRSIVSGPGRQVRPMNLVALPGGTGPGNVWSVSPDKWTARHPLDFHLNVPVTRAVNFFVHGKGKALDKVQLTGFFNPTVADPNGNLPGSEAEAQIVRTVLPSPTVYLREQASLDNLRRAAPSNITHLSMHGAFNEALFALSVDRLTL